jgi:hypothetical protein
MNLAYEEGGNRSVYMYIHSVVCRQVYTAYQEEKIGQTIPTIVPPLPNYVWSILITKVGFKSGKTER